MSYTFAMSCPRNALPDVAGWNHAITRSGFDLALEEFDWQTHSGFLPATMLGVRTGFEIAVGFQDVDSIVSIDLHS